MQFLVSCFDRKISMPGFVSKSNSDGQQKSGVLGNLLAVVMRRHTCWCNLLVFMTFWLKVNKKKIKARMVWSLSMQRVKEVIIYSATTSTKATQENFLQTSQWESHIGTMDFHKINYVRQIYHCRSTTKFKLRLFCCFITWTLLTNL